jgi:nitrate/nitrite-specific signal transduction histidine kinase
MSFLSILKLVVQLLPLVIQAVKAAEEAIPQSGQGAAKFQFVRELLTTTSDIGTEVSEKDYVNALDKTIALAVKLFNATGVFKKA